CLTSASGRTLQALTMLPTRPIRALSWSYSSLSAPVASASEMVRIQVTALPLPPSPSRSKWMLERSERVQGDRVVVQDLALDLRADVGPFLEGLDRVDVARGIGVSVVGPDHQAAFAAVLEDVRDVIAVLAGHVQAVLLGDVRRPLAPL